MVHVFRTSVNNNLEIKRVQPLLNGLLGEGEKWNFDLEDRDKILRVEGYTDAESIMHRIRLAGFTCDELED